MDFKIFPYFSSNCVIIAKIIAKILNKIRIYFIFFFVLRNGSYSQSHGKISFPCNVKKDYFWGCMKRFLFIFFFISRWIGLSASSMVEIGKLPAPYNELTKILPYNPHGFYGNRSEMEKLLAQHKPKYVVELGSWLGQSTCHIASCLPEDGKVYAVDHWLGSVEHRTPNRKDVYHLLPTLYEQFLSNVIHNGLCNKIIPWKMTTEDAAIYAQQQGIKIDLVYVDASHDEENVYNDLCHWYPFVKDNGILCGDDWEWGEEKGYPIRKAVTRFAFENNLKAVPKDNSFWVLEKGEKVPDWQASQLELELESIDLRNFRPQSILESYKAVESELARGCDSIEIYHVKICDNQKIYINDCLAENRECNLAKLMIKLRDKASFLTPCSFLYTRNGQNLLKYKQLQEVPVLIGSKFSSFLTNQITFIEECSTVDLGENQKEWSLEFCIKEVLKYRNSLTWDQKIPKCFWRGYLSDNMRSYPFQMPDGSLVALSPRMIIHILHHFHPSFIDAKITNLNPLDKDNFPTQAISNILGLEKNDYPVGLYGSLEINPRMSIEDHLKYRYQIVLDGVHATNPGYLWRLLSGSLVFKQESPFSQWFYAGLKPNVHFIPVNRDLSNLLEKLQYTIKDDAESKNIALQATEFAETYLYPDKFFEHAHYVLSRYAQKQKKCHS